MRPLAPEEEWARRLIEVELRVPVSQHDDGSSPGMFDLNVEYPGSEHAAVEVVAAVDEKSTELWNVVNGRGRWVNRRLLGGWGVTVKPTARRLRHELPMFLASLEHAGVREWSTGVGVNGLRSPVGVVRARQSATEFPGAIYVYLDLPPEQVAGYAADSGDELAEWIASFLSDDARADVRKKLVGARRAERHTFIIVSGLSGAPFDVTDLLIRDDAPQPEVAPTLPPEVTDVWLVSTWDSGAGFRWSSRDRRWRRFSKRLPDAG